MMSVSVEEDLVARNKAFIELMRKYHPERDPRRLRRKRKAPERAVMLEPDHVPDAGKMVEAAKLVPVPLTSADVLRAVACVTGYSVDELRGDRRFRDLVRARQVVCWMARTRLGLSFPQIGHRIGRDHTTVLHAACLIDRLLAEGDERVAQIVDAADRVLAQRRWRDAA